MTTPAGWYNDPEQPGHKRYWDGTSWTEHRQPPPEVAVVEPTPTTPSEPTPPAASPPAKKSNWLVRHPVWSAVIAAVLLLFCVGGIAGALGGGNTNTDIPTAQSTPPPTEGESSEPEPTPSEEETSAEPSESPTEDAGPPVAFSKTGTLLVPQEVKPGTYTAPDPGGCYWAVLKNLSGGFNSIITNGNASGPVIVTVPSNAKAFETDGCGDWLKGTPTITDDPAQIDDGIWSVPNNIKPGTYRTTNAKSCYWARLRDFTGDLNSIIANDNAKGQAIVRISSSDAGFESSRCGTWKRVG